MSDVKLIAVPNNNDSVSACGARILIESRAGNREIALIKGQPLALYLKDWDKVSCVYGAVMVGLIFTKRRNGVSLNLSSMPNQGERREITISAYLLDELIRESLAKSPNAPKIDYTGVDLSQMAGVFGR